MFYFDVVGPLMALTILLARRHVISKELRLILAFCMVQFLCNLLSSFEIFTINGSNYWVYKLNTILSFTVILILFGKYLIPLKRSIVIIFVSVLLVLNIFAVIAGDGISAYNSNSAALSSFVIVSFCLYYFYHSLIRSSPEESIPSTAMFWCIVGLFTYYTGAFFIFISYKYLIETDPRTVSTLWKFHNLLLFICCSYISYGILCKDYQTT